MNTLARYLSNATSKGITPQQSYDNLISEFRKGNVSYPRTDSKNHAPLKVLDENNVNKYVKEQIEKEPNFEIIDLGDSILVKGDFFMLNEHLKLSTPATIIEDYKKACKKDYKKDVNLYVGLEHYQIEQSLQNNYIELENFNFNNLLLTTVSQELNILEEDLEIKFHDF